MPRRVRRTLVPLALVLLTATACSNNTVTTTAPTTPTSTISEPFGPASLNTNGAFTWTFAVAVPGPVAATVQTVSPDSTVVIGLALGTWNGTGCQIIVPIENARQGTSVSGNISTAGNLCVRVYDVGNVVHPESVSVVVTHL
jgi:hypothetical protein